MTPKTWILRFILQVMRVLEKCEVERVVTNGRRVTGVQTSQGTIECKHFVNASGMVSLTKVLILIKK